MTKRGKGIFFFIGEMLITRGKPISSQTWRIMKFTSLMLLIAFVQVAANGYSQITINKKNASLEEILIEIHNQTGYSYSIGQKSLQKAKNVDINIKNGSLDQVLSISLKDQPVAYFIRDKIVVIRNISSDTSEGDQNTTNLFEYIDIKGRIINEKNEPVIATVQVKGTRNAVSTNTEGWFLISKVETNAVLVITGVTINSTEIKINGKEDLGNILVKTKITTGEGVIVEINTGYQTLKTNEVVGSVTVIDNKTLNEQKGTNIIQRLIGVTNGLLFNVGKTDASGKSSQLQIRGLSTINASTEPLIIMDNFPFVGNIENINPNDVESITVLKDAAATAIYGVRGGNGVIVITTKKGRFNQKIKIEFNSNLIVTEQPDLYYKPIMNSSDYIDVEQYLFNKGYDFAGRLSNSYSDITPAMKIFLDRKTGLISAQDSASRIDALKRIDSRQQADKYFYSNSTVQQYSLNIRGGGNNISWIISGNYEKGISTLDAKSDKINIRLNNTYKPFKDAEISLGVYYTNVTTKSGKSAPENLQVREAPYILFADEKGIPLPVASRYRNSFSDTLGGGQLLDWKNYPLDNYKHDVTKGRREEILADIGFKYRFLKNSLNVSVNYQYQRQFSESKRVADLESFYTRNLINSFTNLNVPSTSLELRNPIPIGNIMLFGNSALASQNFRVQLQGEKAIGNHNISGIMGFELRSVNGLGGTNASVYGYDDNPSLYAEVDFRRVYPDFVTGAPSTIPGEPAHLSTTASRSVSVYGNVAYIYKSRYSINVSARKDASNIFGLSANDKWTPLWSAGMGWDISKEDFYQLGLIPRLKLKMTWGYSGNVDLSKVSTAYVRYFGGYNIAGFPFTSPPGPTNQNLKWERVRQVNVGLDFATKRDVVSGSIEIYQKKGLDLYGTTPFDYTVFGLSADITKNVANMKGTGFDIQIVTRNINRRSVSWSSTFIINYNANKTTKYFDQSSQTGVSIIVSDGNRITPVVGKPLYAIAAFRWGGLDASGNPQGYLDGKSTSDYSSLITMVGSKGIFSNDVVYVGSSSPVLFGSIANRIMWKKISLSANVLYKAGYYFRKPVISYQSLIERGIGHSDFAKRWRQPGDELITSVPAFLYPVNSSRDLFYAQSEVNVLRADNIRLQFVNVDFALSKKVSLYFNAANLGIIWQSCDRELDPDYYNSIPPSKSYTIGVRCEL